MNFPSPTRLSAIAMMAAAMFFLGCHGNQQSFSTDSTAQPDQASGDPATANLAPVSYQSAPQQSAYPDEYPGEYSDQSDDSADESYYGVEPVATALDPPPPLPDYDQPPCPGDGYIWTPGYWDYASTGYYWVPGVWVQAPYVDALWTPGYWGFSHGHYAFFHGYWGPHIGFYGDIDYGYGYTGVGYQGGYWNSDHFYYNREANNVNTTVVRNVYSRTVENNTTVNHVSYNGGSRGIQARPQPAELAALREPHAPPMKTQVQVERSASMNRQQFASVNHGRPSEEAETHPVAADTNVRPAAPTNVRNLPANARPPLVARNNSEQTNRPPLTPGEPSRPISPPSSPERPQLESNRPNTAPAVPHAYTEPGRQEQPRPAPAPSASNRPQPMNRPEPQPRPQAQPNPLQPPRPPMQQTQPNRPPIAEPNRQQQTEPNRQAESRPAPQPSRPAPPQNHPAPPASHPAPQPAPQEHKSDEPHR